MLVVELLLVIKLVPEVVLVVETMHLWMLVLVVVSVHVRGLALTVGSELRSMAAAALMSLPVGHTPLAAVYLAACSAKDRRWAGNQEATMQGWPQWHDSLARLKVVLRGVQPVHHPSLLVCDAYS